MTVLRTTLCTTALGLLLACQPDAGPGGLSRAFASVMATCSSASGEVQVRRAGEGYWTGIATGVLFQPGDWVRTARASHARVEFRGGGALDLDDDALVVIEAVEALPVASATPADQPLGGAGAQAMVEVKQGVVRGIIAPQSERRPTPSLLVKAADGSRVRLGRKGAGDVEVTLTRNADRTELTVSKGEATVAIAGKPEQVFATGRAAQVTFGELDPIEALAEPAPSQPGADARLFATAPVKLSWGKVSAATGYRLQVANDAAFTDGLEIAEIAAERHLLPPRRPGVAYFRVAARDAAGRLWLYGPSRRLFFEKDPPRELLSAPAEGATFGYPGTPPRILLSWAKVEGARSYRVMVSSGADFSGAVVSEVTTSLEHLVETLTPGVYRWGVWAIEDARPLFLSPRTLRVVKVPPLRAPRVITKWGDK